MNGPTVNTPSSATTPAPPAAHQAGHPRSGRAVGAPPQKAGRDHQAGRPQDRQQHRHRPRVLVVDRPGGAGARGFGHHAAQHRQRPQPEVGADEQDHPHGDLPAGRPSAGRRVCWCAHDHQCGGGVAGGARDGGPLDFPGGDQPPACAGCSRGGRRCA